MTFEFVICIELNNKLYICEDASCVFVVLSIIPILHLNCERERSHLYVERTLNDTMYRVEIRNFILDAPARAFIKCIRGHMSRRACEKCHVTGMRYKNIFLEHDAPLCNDEEFRSKIDVAHHISGITSPLEEIGIATECRTHLAVSNFSAFKYENYLGVIKRYLRGAHIPLQQLYNKDFERGSRLMQKDMTYAKRIELSQKHYEESDEIVFSKLTMHL
ncbi:hypothetical protein RF55_17972 [Lasius niger]|uniref:Uncharacterized protein n=1 Tax=Lasius niger TaxID=67767 RepID=A0A0J7K1W8_LASNI|nr:hypothetical protein RF55_17972 [Lasius niger]